MLTYLAIVSFFGGVLGRDLQVKPDRLEIGGVGLRVMGALALVTLVYLINADAS